MNTMQRRLGQDKIEHKMILLINWKNIEPNLYWLPGFELKLTQKIQEA